MTAALLIGALLVLAAGFTRRAVVRRRVWLHAFLEQQRREDGHPVEYRHEQRVRAIQQRLSRRWGKKALTHDMARRIHGALK